MSHFDRQFVLHYCHLQYHCVQCDSVHTFSVSVCVYYCLLFRHWLSNVNNTYWSTRTMRLAASMPVIGSWLYVISWTLASTSLVINRAWKLLWTCWRWCTICYFVTMIVVLSIYNVTVDISLGQPITLQPLEVSLVIRVFPKEKRLWNMNC